MCINEHYIVSYNKSSHTGSFLSTDMSTIVLKCLKDVEILLICVLLILVKTLILYFA